MRIAGDAMLKVKDIMTKDLITVSPEMEIVHATKLLLENHINGVPVMDETGKLVGIVGKEDILRTLIPRSES
jgi:CBS-domain-containing membrane protein